MEDDRGRLARQDTLVSLLGVSTARFKNDEEEVGAWDQCEVILILWCSVHCCSKGCSREESVVREEPNPFDHVTVRSHHSFHFNFECNDPMPACTRTKSSAAYRVEGFS